MILRRQSIYQPARNVLHGVVGLSPMGYLGASDMFVDTACAWVKDRTRAN